MSSLTPDNFDWAEEVIKASNTSYSSPNGSSNSRMTTEMLKHKIEQLARKLSSVAPRDPQTPESAFITPENSPKRETMEETVRRMLLQGTAERRQSQEENFEEKVRKLLSR